MRAAALTLAFCAMAGMGLAEPLSFSDARKALPNAGKRVSVTTYADRVPESDIAKLQAAGLTLKQTFKQIGASLEGYGAVAISPDEGLVVSYIKGVGQHHSLEAARNAAVNYCNANKGQGAASCVVVVEASPRGAKDGAALTLSASANAALRREYRKLSAPKAFAISPSTGAFGFDRGDGGRAITACARGGASDCRIVVADQG